MNLYRAQPSPVEKMSRRAAIVSLLQEASAGISIQQMAGYVERCHVSQEWLNVAVRHVLARPELVSVEKSEFLDAARAARPELAGILLTEAGDRWLEEVMRVLPAQLLMGGLGALFGRSVAGGR